MCRFLNYLNEKKGKCLDILGANLRIFFEIRWGKFSVLKITTPSPFYMLVMDAHVKIESMKIA